MKVHGYTYIYSIQIPNGSVYALIGPSGCGKTTFLRTLFGLQLTSAGQLYLFGLPAGDKRVAIPGHDIGYMPQNDSLCDELSIREIVSYYGYLYGMSRKEMSVRSQYLIKSLNILNENQLVRSLSGGERRRIAFIGAVINSSRLIVLDEPTVGCDPIISEFMWQYLRQLTSQKGCTIVLTTHYLEESRRADQIGCMRDGQILCQGEPKQILHRFGASSIEDAFAIMYQKDGLRRKFDSHQSSNNWPRKEEDKLVSIVGPRQGGDSMLPSVAQKMDKESSLDRFLNHCSIFMGIFYKSFLRYLHYKIFVMGSISVILFLVMLTALCLGSTPKGLKIGLIDYDRSNLSQAFLNRIDTQMIVLIPNIKSYHEAQKLVQQNRLTGFIEIFENLSDSLRCFFMKKQSYCSYTRSTSIVYTGNSVDLIVYQSIDHLLDASFQNASQDFAKILDIDPAYARRPIEVKQPMGASSDPEDLYNVRNFYLPVFTIFWSSVSVLMMSAFIFHLDVKPSVFEHTRAIGGTGTQVVIANFLICCIAPLISSYPVLLCVMHFFNAAGLNSLFLVWTLYMASSLCSIAIGFVFASFCKEPFYLLIGITAFVFGSMSICGHIRPVNVVPYFMLPLRYLAPYTVIADEVIRIGSLGIHWGEPSVLLMFFYSIIYLICCFVILKLRFKI
ncbi:ABC transporter G family member 20-like [Brevipalpus obovatus]|uniref:ABC transporter G family member 20-like n=1 Tax=Brevipalpus obovatus TaxID=246614 RepID=UPI003D9E7A15